MSGHGSPHAADADFRALLRPALSPIELIEQARVVDGMQSAAEFRCSIAENMGMSPFQTQIDPEGASWTFPRKKSNLVARDESGPKPADGHTHKLASICLS